MLTAARISSVVAVSTALVCAVALPATAAGSPSADTTVTVIVSGGSLAVSAPTSATFGTLTPGNLVPALVSLPDVKVTDTRAGQVGWQARVASTDFIGTLPNNKFSAGAATYVPLAAVTTGVATVTPAVLPVTLSSTAQPVQTATVVVGNNTATWSPELALSVPSSALADTYTATLTHSVL